MRRGPLMAAALLTLAACAATPKPQAEPVEAAPGVTERYGPLIEQRAVALLAAEAAGLEVSILSVEETAAGLFYTAELRAPTRRRRDEAYVIYGQCAPADLAACASQIVSGARMLAKSD